MNGTRVAMKEGDDFALLLDLRDTKHPRLGFFLNKKWIGWKFDMSKGSYSVPMPTEFRLMVCIAHFITIRIKKYFASVSSIQMYVDPSATQTNISDILSKATK